MVLVEEEKAMVLVEEEEDEVEFEVEKDLVMSLQELLLLILHQQKKPKQHVEKKLYLQPLYICILVSLPLLHLVLLVIFELVAAKLILHPCIHTLDLLSSS